MSRDVLLRRFFCFSSSNKGISQTLQQEKPGRERSKKTTSDEEEEEEYIYITWIISHPAFLHVNVYSSSSFFIDDFYMSKTRRKNTLSTTIVCIRSYFQFDKIILSFIFFLLFLFRIFFFVFICFTIYMHIRMFVSGYI